MTDEEMRERLLTTAHFLEREADTWDGHASKALQFHWKQRLHLLAQKMRDAAVAARQAGR